MERDYIRIGQNQLKQSKSKMQSWFFYRRGLHKRELRNLGYHDKDIAVADESAFCYACLTLKCQGKFDLQGSNNPNTLIKAITHTKSYTEATESRECVDCLLKRVDMRAQHGDARWIKTTTYRMLVCTKCDRLKKTKEGHCSRQRRAARCDECFEAELAKWHRYRQNLQQWKGAIQEYLDWMDDIERDRTNDSPPDDFDLMGLQALECKGWKYVDPRESDSEDDADVNPGGETDEAASTNYHGLGIETTGR